ncbi:unnamed protein product [Brassica oleracea var. botrytis]|uniref:(rape) hypothetical protein n=1 Tax=Brassica napus TaxID=3708 RepID=A0A816J708_BRANA|nr:unnamed protein product [Brassica napus]
MSRQLLSNNGFQLFKQSDVDAPISNSLKQVDLAWEELRLPAFCQILAFGAAGCLRGWLWWVVG